MQGGKERELREGGGLTSMKTSNQSQEENSVSHRRFKGGIESLLT